MLNNTLQKKIIVVLFLYEYSFIKVTVNNHETTHQNKIQNELLLFL